MEYVNDRYYSIPISKLGVTTYHVCIACIIKLYPDSSLQELLKKLHTLQTAAKKKSSAATGAKQSAERNLSASVNDKTPPTPEDAPTSTTRAPNGKTHGLSKSIEPTLQHVTNKFDPVFWWFHSVRVKVGKTHIVLPSGKLMLLFSLLFSTLYVLRRKGAGLKR
jgi:hypothetical protein